MCSCELPPIDNRNKICYKKWNINSTPGQAVDTVQPAEAGMQDVEKRGSQGGKKEKNL